MKTFLPVLALLVLCGDGFAQPQIPDPLKSWQDWATWDVKDRESPTPYNKSDKRLTFWPGALTLKAEAQAASWEMTVAVYSSTWVALPGGGELWPFEVRLNGSPVAVVEHDRRPSLQLTPGSHRISGSFRWESIPQWVPIPSQIGIVALSVEGKRIDAPNWDTSGNLWLKRARSEAADKDALDLHLYSLVEDGIPMWLRMEMQLTVSGKSREEQFGGVVPEGWMISMVDSPLPVAVDAQGRIKAQVRAGKWTIRVDAFSASDVRQFRFANGVAPAAGTQLIGFRSKPEFRVADLEGLPVIDVTQTTYPKQWANVPVYQWQTNKEFTLVEKLRGMGEQKPAGLRFERKFWLDGDGRGFTYKDVITGESQQLWRLDVAEGFDLGGVRMDGVGQLITKNPANGAHGVEIRNRNLKLEATGRGAHLANLPATGWQTPADALTVRLQLPPGWRLFALFGADWVKGDWLTSWTLLDLFLLLIFSIAVFRLWGFAPGLLALAAFGLSYHEPGAPRYTCFMLLLPLALLRLVGPGTARKWLTAFKYAALAVWLLFLVPFVAKQIQWAIYPQLEPAKQFSAPASYALEDAVSATFSSAPVRSRSSGLQEYAKDAERGQRQQVAQNMIQDVKAKIQVGPAEPQWAWREVSFGWSGPVSAQQRVNPVLIPMPLQRLLTVLRIVLLLWLGKLLLGVPMRLPRGAGVAALLLLLFLPASAKAQFPDEQALKTLRDRLLAPSEAYPNAAEIPSVDLKLNNGRISMALEVNAAIPVAVPLPGRLQTWSPVSVKLDDKSEATVRRDDGYLWVLVPAGVHRVSVEGMLPEVTDWAWTFVLKPRRVAIDAPGWSVTGLRPNGVPENQVFFARQARETDEVSYDRKDFNAAVSVERNLQIGLIWQVRTVVRRLSSASKAVALKVPLLAGERVISSNVVTGDGQVEVRLGAGESQFIWESELSQTDSLGLAADKSGHWVEQWRLAVSPIWNVSFAGLAPVFESGNSELAPVWYPWPGERVALNFSRPAAVQGETVTVRSVKHSSSPGQRQRSATLDLDIECSLGGDFAIDLDPNAQITTLLHNGNAIPVRRQEGKLIVPVRPGIQTLHVEWRTQEALKTVTSVGKVVLPVAASNITTSIHVPTSRWVLWANGPLRGPAVRFWSVLAWSLLAALVLGSLPFSPLRRGEWLLLALGLTQVHFTAALVVVAWFFLLAWRGQNRGPMERWAFDLFQLLLVGLTAVALGVLVAAVGEGLLGRPEMFIQGNDSARDLLNWFEPRGALKLPQPWMASVSIWFYRLLMLAWALWLAMALLRWLRWAWIQFGQNGYWKRKSKLSIPPPL